MNQKSLFSGERPLYSFPVAAKSATGRRNPCFSMATPDAPCVFFCVYASVHPLFGKWLLNHLSVKIMVARAGQPSGWPVSIEAGIPTPVRATTLERRNSGGSNNRYSMEIVVMTTVLTASRPKFIFIFAAVHCTDRAARPCKLRFAAKDERTTRANFIRDYVLCFAGRVPVQAVTA
ncbi:ash family protein [Pantoea sp. BIGb0393]|uniref:Host cell division inhibitor Icd-like protein n=1 Tax=Pantoea nemavictus TaxID=2726955 RepID=A0ABU8PPM6_9GAMM|nr:host cell division inhibitor Icd-like protein [Pantoea nemavictus]MBA0035492.1 ash family protein [Pantoea nemavictus]